jgi:hypothetical protein
MYRIKPLGPVIRRSSDCTRPSERRGMLVWNKLRIDPNDGSPVVEYRIENGRVERRTLGASAQGSTTIEAQWQRLTPEQLTSHVMANTVIAHWLSRRLGARSLIRACTQHSSGVSRGAQERHYDKREVVVGEFTPLLWEQPEGRADSSTVL